MCITNLPNLLCGDLSRLVRWSCQPAPGSSLAPCIGAVVLCNIVSFVYSAPLNKGKVDCVTSTLEGNFKTLVSGADLYINKCLESGQATSLSHPSCQDCNHFLY